MNLREQLETLDKKCFIEGSKFYNLMPLYEATNLDAQEKQKLTELLDSTDDAGDIYDFLQGKAFDVDNTNDYCNDKVELDSEKYTVEWKDILSDCPVRMQFDSKEEAQKLFNQLQAEGFDDISISGAEKHIENDCVNCEPVECDSCEDSDNCCEVTIIEESDDISAWEEERRAIVDWLEMHTEAYEDAKKALGDVDLWSIDKSKLAELKNWICEHDQLANDFENHFGFSLCDSDGSEELEQEDEDKEIITEDTDENDSFWDQDLSVEEIRNLDPSEVLDRILDEFLPEDAESNTQGGGNMGSIDWIDRDAWEHRWIDCWGIEEEVEEALQKATSLSDLYNELDSIVGDRMYFEIMDSEDDEDDEDELDEEFENKEVCKRCGHVIDGSNYTLTDKGICNYCEDEIDYTDDFEPFDVDDSEKLDESWYTTFQNKANEALENTRLVKKAINESVSNTMSNILNEDTMDNFFKQIANGQIDINGSAQVAKEVDKEIKAAEEKSADENVVEDELTEDYNPTDVANYKKYYRRLRLIDEDRDLCEEDMTDSSLDACCGYFSMSKPKMKKFLLLKLN